MTYKPKSYPLEIEEVGTDVDPYHVYILMSRGHHDVHEFMKKVRMEGYDLPLGMPRHIWLRTVPYRSGKFKCNYVNANQGERGAFPVTHTSVILCKEYTYEQLNAAN